MNIGKINQRKPGKILTVLFFLALVVTIGWGASGISTAEETPGHAQTAEFEPQDIPEGVSCGKCGMYPAKYPRWHSQIVFKDNTMTAFDGCKCMFSYLNELKQHDESDHSKHAAAVFVKDFNSGKWMKGPDAHYVVGSSMMGPMGMEAIPFASKDSAMRFHHDNGGEMMMYSEITPEVLKTLMGGMHHGYDSKEHGSSHETTEHGHAHESNEHGHKSGHESEHHGSGHHM